MSTNLEQAYEKFTEEYANKSNTVSWFLAQFKTHLSKNITLEDWNTLQQHLKNVISDGESIKKLLDSIFKYLSEDNTYTDEEINNLLANASVGVTDLGTFATNRPIEEGLKEFFIAAEKLNLGYYDNRIFIGMVSDIKVMAIGHAGGDLAVYTERFEQYTVGYDDADLLAVRHEPSKVRNIGAFETSTIEDGLKQFVIEVARYHINYNKYGTTTCLYTGEIAGDIPVFTWYNGDDVVNVYAPNTTYKVSNLFDEENITITNISSYTKTEVDNKLTRSNLISIIGDATNSKTGLMSATDKNNLNSLVALMQEDSDSFVNTIAEVLRIFQKYPEGQDIVSILSEKADVDYVDYKYLQLDASKANKSSTYTKTEIDSKLGDIDAILDAINGEVV